MLRFKRLNPIERRKNHGPIEGINRKIKAFKRICYGFKNMDHFYARIILIRFYNIWYW
ncbi:transposase [Liquorilactobacillus ghanensis]|uniref:transposase n=1 Tax=Liquorilactobacillus ghanensis TaxID=399370 RepID=UPI0039E846FE